MRLIVALLALSLAGCSDSSDIRTIYLFQCDKPLEEGFRCKGKAKRFTQFTIRVFPDSQQVMWKTNRGAKSLGKCEVFDADNWHCPHENGIGGDLMAEGKYFRTPDYGVFQVGFFRWMKCDWLSRCS